MRKVARSLFAEIIHISLISLYCRLPFPIASYMQPIKPNTPPQLPNLRFIPDAQQIYRDNNAVAEKRCDPEERSAQIEFQKPDMEATTVQRRLSGVSPARVSPRKFKEVAFNEGIKLSQRRFQGTDETGLLKPDQSLHHTSPSPSYLYLLFPLPKFARSFINARPVEFPPRTFHLPFQRPSISHWKTLKRVMNYSKLRYSANIQADKLSVSLNLLWNRNVLFGIETSVEDAWVSI